MIVHEWCETPGLPLDVNWNTGVSLLLDGINTKDLLARLYAWQGTPHFEPLYLGTRWQGMLDLSPCLVRVGSRSDQAVQQFLANLDQDWGYLLTSNRPWQEQVDHVRWLTSVCHPQGQVMLFKVADPVVMRTLLEHAQTRDDWTLFGPFQQILTADARERRWYLHQREGVMPTPDHAAPYRVTEKQLTLLEEVNFTRVVSRLESYLNQHFPAYQHAPDLTRWEQAYRLTSQAYEQGMSSEREITQYASVHCFLGADVLQQYPKFALGIAEMVKRNDFRQLLEHAQGAKLYAEQLKSSS